MAKTYRITAPDGSVYNVTPPEGVEPSEDEIMRQVQAQHGQQAKPGEGGPEQFTPVSPDPYGIGDIERQRREMVGQHGIASNPGLAPQSVKPAQSPQQPQDTDFRSGPLIQSGVGVAEGFAGLPGLPVEIAAGLSNFVRRNTGSQPLPVSESPVKDWGAQGWADYLLPGHNNVPDPSGPVAAFARKAGNFAGGALPFGPAGMVPAMTGAIGSEAGKKLDEVAPEYTKGYGEFAGGVVGGLAGAARRVPATSAAPTIDQLRAQARAAYDAADRAGVVYTPNGVTRLGVDVVNDLANDAYLPSMQPKIKSVLDHLNEISQGNVTLKGIDTLRKAAGNAAKSGDATERMMASKIIDRIDEFVAKPQQGDILMGDAQAGADALQNARALYHRMSKADKIDAALENADLQSASTYSGGNIDNATRQKLRPMISRNNKQNRGWTPDEAAMLRKVVRGGGLTQNVLRRVGKLSPENGGLMAQLSLLGGGGGAVAGLGPLGFAPSAAGFVAKRAADAMTRSNVADLLDTVRRGQAYQAPSAGRMLTRAAAPLPGNLQSAQRKRMLTKP
jgi:hypothetical protein